MSLPPGFLEELRNRVSISTVVGRKVTWDQRKTNVARGDYWAPCPFHQEKTASFHVDEQKGYYYCFGCHAKGDVLTFLRENENLGFMEAVEMLASEAGMTMPARDPVAAAKAAANQGLSEAVEAAVQFYRMMLNSARAGDARAYLERRGMNAATQEAFEIGFAPEGRTVLFEHLKQKGFEPKKLEEAGLVGLPQDGSAYDKFRGRIMFPIRDGRGRAIGFGARALRDGQEPKYLNSPETPLFDKGRTLYNIGPARSAAHKAGTVIVTEGYMDVIGLAAAGIANAVAPLGTAITETQLAMLWKLSPEPVVALDGDKAGLKAAHRLMDLALPLLGANRSLRFALMPAGKDPDDVVREGGAAAMNALIGGSQPLIALLWSRETEGQVLDSPERRAALDARLRAHLANIADPGLRAHYQAEIKNRRVELFAPARKSSNTDRAWKPRGPWRPGRFAPDRPLSATRASLLAQSGNAAYTPMQIRECAILAGCLNHPDLAAEIEEKIEFLPFSSVELGEIRNALLSALGSALSQGDPVTALREAVATATGRDAAEIVNRPGQVRANPCLKPDADKKLALRAIDEEILRHQAILGREAEIREAARELQGSADESVTYRLQEALRAEQTLQKNAVRDTADDAEGQENAAIRARLKALIDGESWKKPRKG